MQRVPGRSVRTPSPGRVGPGRERGPQGRGMGTPGGTDLVLALNTGSTSVKHAVSTASGEVLSSGASAGSVTDEDAPRLWRDVLERLAEDGVDPADLVAVGHRVVHGGPEVTGPALLDDAALRALGDAARFAPLHNPPALALVRAVSGTHPSLPQVAVPDTGFFADLPPGAATLPVDREVVDRLRLRRYGAHGLSHQYVAEQAELLLGREPGTTDVVTLHLGGGASAAAVRAGRPVATSMGLTPLEGLVMASRPGDLDAGVVVELLRSGEVDLDGLEELLHHRSGLQGMAGSSDLREVLAAAGAGDPAARAAYEVYWQRLRHYVGGYLALLEGGHAVVFTGGVGEHAAGLRRDVLRGMEPLGVELDGELNDADGDDARVVSKERSRVAVLVVPTDEQSVVARETRRVLDLT